MGHGAILIGFSQYFLNVPHFLEGKILAKYTVALRKGGMGGGGRNRNTRQDPQILAKYTVAKNGSRSHFEWIFSICFKRAHQMADSDDS